MSKHLLRWLPALSWMGIIFYWSGQPVLPIDHLPNADLAHWLSHVGAYGILAVLLTFGTGLGRRGLWLAFALAALYGIGDEIHQSFTPGRRADVRGVAIDAVSAGITLIVISKVRHWQQIPIFRRV